MTNKELEIEALLAPTVRALGCDIWGVEYRPRGRSSTLKLFIDAPDGVTIDDCERVSSQVSALLDVEDPIVEAYDLEVSSPGLDRTLFKPEQYAASVGERVDVRLAFPFEGRRRFEGCLVGVEDGSVVVRTDDAPAADGGDSDDSDDAAEYLLPLEQIQRARIVPAYAS